MSTIRQFTINRTRIQWITAMWILTVVPCIQGQSQEIDLNYYLQEITYDPEIPTPEEILHYQVGEWHVPHGLMIAYMHTLAEASDRVTIEEYARSHEDRPLVLLTITSPANHANIDAILAQRQKIFEGGPVSDADLAALPIVIYQGYSIHGDEASGTNAALLVAYYLAAGQSAQLDALLDEVVILLDPCLNPDGLERFSVWVNSQKNHTLTADPNDRQFTEPWPTGRSNHYWFDLNRDWLLLQHPESRGRVANFHKWKPVILTDHHEMTSQSTFFFMPGVQTRINPGTPLENQQLTADIAEFHATALDSIGSLYFTEEVYDDFYLGKGSTYPDANGCVGILFEQATARGNIVETRNGPLSFPFAIRNQVVTSLSTHRAALHLRKTLATYQRDFFASAAGKANSEPVQAFVFEERADLARLRAFISILLQHQIDVFRLAKGREAGPLVGDGNQYIVPMAQQQYRMVKGVFERVTSFDDSLFYDVSAWTLPLAFNIETYPVEVGRYRSKMLGERVTFSSMLSSGTSGQDRREMPGVRLTIPPQGAPGIAGASSTYGYLIDWNGYFAPAALYHLLRHDLHVRVTQAPFSMRINGVLTQFDRGTAFVPVREQNLPAEDVLSLIGEAADIGQTRIFSVPTGYTDTGVDLGSSTFERLQTPEVAMLAGQGAGSYASGAFWHLFDTRYHIPLTKIEVSNLEHTDLSSYTSIFMGDGRFGKITDTGVEKIRSWLSAGGTLIVTQRSVHWARNNHLVDLKPKRIAHASRSSDQLKYSTLRADHGRNLIRGAIVEASLDLTHPLCFGFQRDRLPVLRRGTHFFEPAQNPYATPVRYTSDPLLSGYIADTNTNALAGSAAVVVGRMGSGRVICIMDDLAFRGYWWGANKLLANAVFFGSMINSNATERPPASKSVETGND